MDTKMEKLLTLLDLHKQASMAPDTKSFEFAALNQTHKLVPYKQAVSWTRTDLGIKIEGVSGNVSLDQNGSYAQWLKKHLKKHTVPELAENPENNVLCYSHDNMAPADQADWKEYASAHGAAITFRTPQDGILGGLWLERDKAFDDMEKILLEEISLLYAQTLSLLKLREKARFLSFYKRLKKHKAILWVVLIALCFLPVRLSITAPAEIVAQSPTVITVPYDGVLDKIMVKPGETIRPDQILFEMDRTELDGEIKSSEQALKTAQKNLSRIRRESLREPEKKADITKLSSEIEARKIEYNHARQLIEKSTMRATKPGVAIFSDSNDFEGRPVRTGEKVMVIADPENIELLIKVPMDNMVPISKEDAVSFYLNVSPLQGYEAEIISMGYQAGIDPDGLLTYKIRARILDQSDIRIGWKGTAKIKGEWSILSYSILRRPLAIFRHITGL